MSGILFIWFSMQGEFKDEKKCEGGEGGGLLLFLSSISRGNISFSGGGEREEESVNGQI